MECLLMGISRALDYYLFGGKYTSNEKTMTQDEWEKKFKPILNPFPTGMNYIQDGVEVYGMFETYGEELDHVLKANPLKVWTEIHASGSFEGIESGMLRVDRMGYYITEIARKPNEIISIDFHNGCECRDAKRIHFLGAWADHSCTWDDYQWKEWLQEQLEEQGHQKNLIPTILSKYVQQQIDLL